MTYQDRLTEEINTVLDELADQDSPWRAAWIAHGICHAHRDGLQEGEAADFWRHCGYADCRKEVTRCINRRAAIEGEEGEDPQQLRLPGFKHLQMYYVVEREDEDKTGYPVEDCTDPELEAKSLQLRAMGQACFAHADEIDRYLRQRGRQAG